MGKTGRPFANCPIAIVSAGCALPGAANVESFWVRLMEGVSSIGPLPETRWQSRHHFQADRGDREKSYTRHAAFIPDAEYRRLHKKWAEPNMPLCPMRLLIFEAANQVLAAFPKGFKGRKVDFFIGCMHYDDGAVNSNFDTETVEIRRVLSEMNEPEAETWQSQFESWRDKTVVPYLRGEVGRLPHVIHDLQEMHGFRGTGSFVDAACASSFAAMDVGIRRLMSGDADMVITGGVEACLGPSAFVSFTSMGALATEACLPFDKRSEGTSLGEGCALFMMQRLDDAIRDGNEIMGVIEGIGASSDGSVASLFSPTVNGQRRAYTECYQGVDTNRIAYLECHGTGTPLGDAVEVQSAAEFFNRATVPIGSTKAIWGHTRGAAGAVGMLKALMVLKHQMIPPSRYCQEKIKGFPPQLTVPSEATTLSGDDNTLVGVSSFGFGGINYHVAVGRKGPTDIVCETTPAKSEALLVASEEFQFSELEKITDWSEYKISPRSRRQTDVTQLAALVAARRVIEKSHIPLKLLDKKRVGVISTAPIGLAIIKQFATSFKYRELDEVFTGMPPERFAEIQALRMRYPPITEDTSSGGINNVIAGRICNFFDFQGKSYHFDSDYLSWPMALQAATAELQDHADLMIVVGLSYAQREGDWSGDIKYLTAVASILTNLETAERLALRVNSIVQVSEART